ncbi:MAG: hypothetical protein ACJAY3_001360 [Neolewinella sp.]
MKWNLPFVLVVFAQSHGEPEEMEMRETGKHIFISHASADDQFVKALRIKLELHGLSVWVDSRNLRSGAKLEPAIEQALDQAEYVIAVPAKLVDVLYSGH